MYSVFILEDDAATRNRLCTIVEEDDSLNLVKSEATLKASRKWFVDSRVDILLVDLGLQDGYGADLIREVSQAYSDTRIMVISRLGDENSVIEAIKAGAVGYLLKDNDESHILDGIKQLAKGGSPISPAIAGYILDFYKKRFSYQTTDNPLSQHNLTAREKDVLQYVARGYTNKEIGNALEISPHTVASHVKNIYEKLEVTSRSEAASEYYSYQNGDDILQKSALQMSQAMRTANKPAEEILELLEITFHDNYRNSIKTLYETGFSIKTIFIAIRAYFKVDDKDITHQLTQLSVEQSEILGGLLDSRG